LEGVGVAPSVGEVLGRMTQGGTIPRFVPAGGDPDPLQALREEIEERLSDNWRDVRLRLLPSDVEYESLMGIGLTCVRLYNELNYEKRQAFFKGELTLPEIKCTRLTGGTTTSTTMS
jgi:hypothetical protein